ncbi:hypothetical protein Tlie_0043 [Thermovirga lienii DSM 17291]|uniref:Prepilin-type N-terminal cleavage/methylation domain-containing protein n=1 Tax=Thermovirga lienii (strain ATCC BAA-1197 / DSM 17291 / Cas60314) TaxID=580340 RepID=G7V5G2_THELD|nr:prepilin-type N-terminal cleavage/methylation domain-containing protein [Thermovirga lienii]AER65789.1 hypothetical protein Tlie_0043 [Thermovirga lienii DSM 17291]
MITTVKRKGVSLVELLIVILLLGIIMGAVVGFLSLFLSHFEVSSSGAKARQRAEMVLSVLNDPVSHAGLGMQISTDDFKESFEGIYDLAVTEEKFPSSLHVSDDNEKLYLVYGKPTGLSVVEKDVTANTIKVNGPISLVADFDWIVFPTGEVPYKVEIVDDYSKEITLSGKENLESVALFDEVYQVKFMEAYVDEDGFHAVDPRTGESVDVKGIKTFQVTYFSDMKVLLVEVEGYGAEGAREENEWLAVSWRVRNL